MVNIQEKKLASAAQRRVNRSSTHIRIKKQVKFELEKWMRKHHVGTHSKAVKRLLDLAGAVS